MAVTKKSISTLIEAQLPEFIYSEYELFGKFVTKYYEHLENQGGTLDVLYVFVFFCNFYIPIYTSKTSFLSDVLYGIMYKLLAATRQTTIQQSST